MKYVAIAVVVILVAAGTGWFLMRGKAEAASAATTQPTSKVERRTLEKIVSANGKVASNRDVDIKCQASGKVIALPYDISAKVKLGDLLMELDPNDQKRSLDQAKAALAASNARLAQAVVAAKVAELNLATTTTRATADLASAKAKLADAQAKAKRTEELFNNKLASREELETAQTTAAQSEANMQGAEAAMAELEQQKLSLETRRQDIESAKAQVAQDAARLGLAEQQFSYTKVYVPDDEASKNADYRISSLGTTANPVQVGTVVQSGSSGFSGGTTVMTLSDVSHMFVLASVDESDIGQIADPAWGLEPQRATVTVDAYPDERFEGEVVRVATKGVSTSNVVTFEVKIEITSPNKALLRPEMTATAKILCNARRDVLSIPVAAFVPVQAPGRRATSGPGSMPSAVQENEGGTRTSEAPATAEAATQPAVAEATTQPTGRGRGGRGRGGRGARGTVTVSLGALLKVEPQVGTVTLWKDDGSTASRDVTVGLSDGEFYEVISGLEEGENVVVNKSSAQSRWRGGGSNIMPRGIGGGGGGGRGMR